MHKFSTPMFLLLLVATPGCGRRDNVAGQTSLPGNSTQNGTSGPTAAEMDRQIPVNATPLERARFHESVKRLTDAQADLEVGLKATPSDKQLALEHAKVMAMQGKRTVGLAELAELMKKHPNDKEALQMQAQILIRTQSVDEGMKAIETATKLYPKDSGVFFDRGCYKAGAKNDMTGAIQDFTKAIQLDENNEEAYIDRGIAYNRLKKFDDSLADFSQAIKMKPNDSVPYVQRAMVYGVQQKTSMVKADLDKVMSLHNNPQAMQMAQTMLNMDPNLKK